jgi:hypothetical protein
MGAMVAAFKIHELGDIFEGRLLSQEFLIPGHMNQLRRTGNELLFVGSPRAVDAHQFMFRWEEFAIWPFSGVRGIVCHRQLFDITRRTCTTED